MDLSCQVLKYLHFLRLVIINDDFKPMVNENIQIDFNGKIKPQTNIIIDRYVRWLLLCKKYPTKNLQPPFDILFVWNVHMLRPHCYRNDCLKLFGGYVPNTCADIFGEISNCSDFFTLWNLEYNEQLCEHKSEKESKIITYNLNEIISFKLDESIWKQILFTRRVVGYRNIKHFTTNVIKNMINRYDKFFDIISPCHKLCPTTDIDIVWHAYQLNPRLYFDHSN